MSDITLLIARLRNGAWEKRWPEELLITAARTMQDLLDENNRLRYSTIELERRLRVQESEKADLLDWKEELLQALEGAAYFMIGMCHDPAVKIMQKEALTGKAKKLLAIVERHLTESDNQETSLDELAALLEEKVDE